MVQGRYAYHHYMQDKCNDDVSVVPIHYVINMSLLVCDVTVIVCDVTVIICDVTMIVCDVTVIVTSL